MTRGTTPIHVFLVDIDLTGATELYITYSQKGTVKIEKSIEDVTIEPEQLTVTLTQEETLNLDVRSCDIQIRAKLGDGSAVASNVIVTAVNPILKNGVI